METQALRNQVNENEVEKRTLLGRINELEQSSALQRVDHAALVQDLEARLEESQAANGEVQKTYQRQVCHLFVLSRPCNVGCITCLSRRFVSRFQR